VTSSFKPGDEVPVALLTRWIDESFRAVAPKKLLSKRGRSPLPLGEG
jgi:hypothetical protein